MVLSASRSDSLIISLEDLQTSNQMLEDLEADMHRVFSRIGRTEDSMQAERFIEFVRRKGAIPYADAYKMIHSYFPDFRDFEGILAGALNSGQLLMQMSANGPVLVAKNASPVPPDIPSAAPIIITTDTIL
jgi:hypothetical protein